MGQNLSNSTSYNDTLGDTMELQKLAQILNFKDKLDRSLALIDAAYQTFGDNLVVANSLGKDSMAVWHLVKTVNPDARGFIVTTRFKPVETIDFMAKVVSIYPELKIFKNDEEIPPALYARDPSRCCEILKVQPVREALKEMQVACWVTGLRCTEGRTRTDYQEMENRDKGLLKLNPILLWQEREIWQYTAINQLPVNPLYAQGYRSLGCAPCTKIANSEGERDGRWIGTSKCGGECGIHTRPLME